MSQSTDIVRRNPSQARALTTVDTFFEATARILETGNESRLTTNHIAERAGFSIGTLYGYFPNKRSLLQAMALREARQQEARVLQALDLAGTEKSAEDLVRIVVRAVLRPFEGRSRLRLAMIALLAKDTDILAAANNAQNNILNVLLQEIATRTGSAIPNTNTRFTLRAAVMGVVQAAANERIDLFESQAFEDDIVQLVMSSLQWNSAEA